MANKTAQYWGTGRRKTAVARVRLVPGTGAVTINERTLTDYVGGREPLMAQELNLRGTAEAAVRQGRLTVAERQLLLEEFRGSLAGYTYYER